MGRKTIRFFDKTIDRMVAILSLLFFLICLYAMYDAYMVYNNAIDKSILKYKPEIGSDPAVLRELSDDAVAWLTIDNTNIDYPVMQGKNNDTYLNKDPFGDYSLSGSIFLDFRNKRDFTDPYSLIYGHHMEYGVMFGALDEFIKPDYYNSHRSGTLITTDGADYRVDFFAACKAQANEKLVFDPPDSNNTNLLAFLKKNAAIYEPEKVSADDHILALSTCQSAETIERMIIFGKLTKISG